MIKSKNLIHLKNLSETSIGSKKAMFKKLKIKDNVVLVGPFQLLPQLNLLQLSSDLALEISQNPNSMIVILDQMDVKEESICTLLTGMQLVEFVLKSLIHTKQKMAHAKKAPAQSLLSKLKAIQDVAHLYLALKPVATKHLCL